MTETEPTVDSEPIRIALHDMKHIQSATIKFRGTLIHADCRQHDEKLLVLVWTTAGEKRYAAIVNDDESITLGITRHQLTMWLHRAVKTIKLSEVDFGDES